MAYNKDTGLYEGYIYLITNKINQKQYIGQTKQKLKYRWKQHIYDATRNDYLYMIIHRAMSKYGIENFEFAELEKICGNTKEELSNYLNQKEIDYIANYNTLTPNGYNMTYGGNHVSLICAKPVDAYDYNGKILGNFDSIVDGADILCNGVVDNISYCCDGKRKHVRGIIWRWKDEPFDKYQLTDNDIINIRLKLGEITIDQYSTDGILMNNFKSSSDIYKYYQNLGETIFITDIIKCCKGILKYAYGFIWRYSFDNFNTYNTDLTKSRQEIVQIDLDFNIISEYSDIYKATESIILDGDNFDTVKKGIYRVCNGDHKTYRNYIWKYKGDEIDRNDYKNGFHQNYIPVNQYKKDIFVATYNSLTEAHNETGVNNISKCCKGRAKVAGGYGWYYADDPNQPDKTKIIPRNNQPNK